jgi:integrase
MARTRLRKISGNYYAYFRQRGREPEEKSWPLRTHRQDVARRRLTKLEEGFDEGDFDPWKGGWLRDDVTVEEGLNRYLDHKRNTCQPSTVTHYESKLTLWKDAAGVASMLCRDLDVSHCRTFIHDREVASSTRKNRYAYLDTFFRWLRNQDLMDSHPLVDVKKPKPEKKTPAFFKPEDIERVIRCIRAHGEITEDAAGRTPDDAWLVDLIHVAVCTGLRRGELRNLRWQDVDLEHGVLHVRNREDGSFRTKGGDERTVPLAGDALDALRRMSQERDDDLDGPVFTGQDGRPIHAERMSRRLKFFVEKAKLDERLHFHSLRHTCASWLSMRGVPLRIIQEILGHASVSQTEIYSHLQPEVMHRAMEETFGRS